MFLPNRVGFMTFVAMDKGLRIATGGEGHDHNHGHGSHSHDTGTDGKAQTSAVEVSSTEVKSRKKAKDTTEPLEQTSDEKGVNPSVKLGGYLNLM